MEFEQVIKNRKSTRLFSSKEVEEEKINKIIEAGILAPTAKNYQPFKIIVVREKENLALIDKVSICRYKAPVVLLIVTDLSKVFKKNNFDTSSMDATIVATHMMLEATNLGVDNIWIEAFDQDKLKELLNLEDKYQISVMLPIGYKSKLCPPSPLHPFRKKKEEIIEYR